jgi:signal transduction histidine kinase
MINPMSIQSERTVFQNMHPALPEMASLFIDVLTTQRNPFDGQRYEWVGASKRQRLIRIPLKKSLVQHNVNQLSRKRHTTDREHNHLLSVSQHASQMGTVRHLVKGISHHFNNLLMGIWGNLSLIRLYSESHSSEMNYGIGEMEALLQDGAYLTHLILGYLGERRIFAQKLRLKQLSKEIQILLKRKQSQNDIAGQLEWGTKSQPNLLISGSTAVIIEHLLMSIQDEGYKLKGLAPQDSRIARRLENIQELIQTGLMMTYRLRCYAGKIKLKKRWINPHHVLKEVLSEFSNNNPAISFSRSISPVVPLMLVDRSKLKFALERLLENAVAAVAGGQGKVQLNVNLLHQEHPEDRCGVSNIGDCLVFTIADNGCGILESAKPRIFEPFYSDHKSPNTSGLGLSAALGIIRQHGGHIQHRSAKEAGCVFKLYLPVEHI